MTPDRIDSQDAPFYREFGQRLRAARGARSQADLGESVGMSRASISNIEAGRQRIPLHLLPEFARALGTSPASLLPGDEPNGAANLPGLEPEERHFVAAVAARMRGEGSDGQA